MNIANIISKNRNTHIKTLLKVFDIKANIHYKFKFHNFLIGNGDMDSQIEILSTLYSYAFVQEVYWSL